ncbi:MAG: diadenylate cyclase CdaA [Longimicrobiales bacterium]
MNDLQQIIGTLDWIDLIQIVLVAAGLYYLLRLLVRTGASQMLIGVLLFIALYLLARALDLRLIRHVLENLFRYGAIALLIIFQPELRSGLARIGRARSFRFLSNLQQREVLDEVVDAVTRLSRAHIGAIIALERETKLEEYAETGTRIQARVESDLLLSIFAPYGPLHDGAVLIAGDTIIAASVILPLTQFPVTDRTLSTRHRAALGLSEESDAVVIVVSEETSIVSVAQRGRIERNIEEERLRALLAGAPMMPSLR